jgi:tetratricopeptide (TPR) repeat protein
MVHRFIACAVLLCLPSSLEAAKVKVLFVDQKSQPVGEVDAKLVNTQSKEEQLKKANKKGELIFDKVKPGSYEVLAQKSGFIPAKLDSVQVADADVSVDLKIVNMDYFTKIETAANTVLQQQKFKEALDGYQQLLELTPGNATVWSNIARANAMLSNWDKAREAAQKAVSLDPSLAPFAKQIEGWGNYTKGQEYLNQKEFPKAVEVLTKAVDNDPTNADAFYALALAYGHQKKYAEAIQSAEKALKIKPDDPEFQNVVKILKHNAEIESKK